MPKTCPTTWWPWCLALLLAALAGCGGGEAHEQAQPDATLHPVDCKAAPQACR